MSKQAAKETESNTPVFRLQRLYVKDISFENPNSPEIFEHSGKAPKVEMDLTLAHRRVIEDHWEVSMKVSAQTRDHDSEKILFEVEVEHAAVFYMRNIPEEHIPVILAVDCPTMILPYTRQIVSQLTVDGGFMPFLLEPVNFRALYEKQRHQAQQAAPAEPTIQ